MTFLAPAAERRNFQPPAAMRDYRQFVVWRLEPKTGQEKPAKVPYDPKTGRHASVSDSTTWGSVAEAQAAYGRGGFDGIGFVFTATDPFAFVDMDDCLDPATGQLTAGSLAIKMWLTGAWEVSQSGRGLHGIGRVSNKARLSCKRRKWTDALGNRFECYTDSRFVAFGSTGWSGDIGPDWSDLLANLVPDAEAGRSADAPAVDWIDQPRAEYDGPPDDDELIRLALASKGGPKSMFGTAPTFAMLWNADQELGKFFPDAGGRDRTFDHSSADLALADALAFWTGCNPARMERLFARSKLNRNDQRKTRLVITKAIADPNRRYFSRKQRVREDQRIGDDLPFEPLPTILTLDQALVDLVFVTSGSQVASRSTKKIRAAADAMRAFAASKHPIDTGKVDELGKPIIKQVPVMKLWQEDAKRLSVDTITWAPGQVEFCHAPERLQGGSDAFNLWIPPRMSEAPPNWQEWAKPFLDHVAYLVPIEAERTRFLKWLAHMFQRPGELPHTHYLMIATNTGIGRGTLASILTRALRGYVAANINVDALFGGFNGRVSQKLLATVDEIREGNAADRYKNAETLKSKLTEETRLINPKYGLQSLEKNCCRWLMFSNHPDALPFENNDRRIIIIENPTDRAAPEWYAYLHGLIGSPVFVASVQHYLMTLPLAGFNAHEPAPINDAKRKALAALESETTKLCRAFAENWPDDLATRNDLVSFIANDALRTSRSLGHDIERAGMKTAHAQKVGAKLETVLIVRGALTPGDIDAMSRAEISRRIISARGEFMRSLWG
jgi:primase-polymerase (primpol)-like protein